jgi:hypothetical protein
LSQYNIFIQRYYKDSPHDVMNGTKECPAIYLGIVEVDTTNKTITNINVSDNVLWALNMELMGENINVLLADNSDEYLYFRDVPFYSKSMKLLSSVLGEE